MPVVLMAAGGSQLSHYGYWGVGLLVSVETLGLPFPGETALIAAAAYAGQSHKLNPWWIFAVAVAAAVVGNVLGYLIGRKGGFRLARRYGRKIRLDERVLKTGRYILDKQGWKIIFVGRFVVGLRTYMAFLAGTLEMNWWEFFAASSLAAGVWAAAYTTAAYQAGNTLRGLSVALDLAAIGIALVVLAAAVLFMRGRLAKLADKAEQAYPGPLGPSQGSPG